MWCAWCGQRVQLGVVTAGGVVYHSWCWQRRCRFLRAFRLLTLWAPDLSLTLLPTIGEAVGVDARKQLAMTEDVLTLYTSEELEDVATELKLTQQMKGDKKGEKVASLLPLLKAGRMTKDVALSPGSAPWGPSRRVGWARRIAPSNPH